MSRYDLPLTGPTKDCIREGYRQGMHAENVSGGGTGQCMGPPQVMHEGGIWHACMGGACLPRKCGRAKACRLGFCHMHCNTATHSVDVACVACVAHYPGHAARPPHVGAYKRNTDAPPDSMQHRMLCTDAPPHAMNSCYCAVVNNHPNDYQLFADSTLRFP